MNTNINDTIVCDTASLNSFINNEAYDYNSEIGETDKSLFDKIMQDLNRWLGGLFGGIDDMTDAVFFDNKSMIYVWIAIAVAIIIALLFFMYKKKMLFFKKKVKVEDDYDVVEDTIYGIDFDEAISQALATNNYREAIRLRYLQCLKWLSDNQVIDWRIFKTPAQYTREFNNNDFVELTRQYVLVRYGGYQASESIFNKIGQCYNLVIESVSSNKTPINNQEGGANED